MIRRTTLAGALALIAASPLVAGTANAAEAESAAAISYVGFDIMPGPTGRAVTTQVVLTPGVGLPDNTRAVAWACTAESIGDAAATRLPECSLWVNGVRFRDVEAANPLNAAASASSNTRVPRGATVYACAKGVGIWLDNTSTAGRRVCTQPQRV